MQHWSCNADWHFEVKIPPLTKFADKVGTSATGATVSNNEETIHSWVFLGCLSLVRQKQIYKYHCIKWPLSSWKCHQRIVCHHYDQIIVDQHIEKLCQCRTLNQNIHLFLKITKRNVPFGNYANGPVTKMWNIFPVGSQS